MTELDLRSAFNALSDVVVNRPEALREYDQIYMKISDMLLQAELLCRWMDGKATVFIGDGDAIGLTLVHLRAEGIFDRGPARVHVLDFDQRIVNSIRVFSKRHGLEGKISAELYNVVDPLPPGHLANFEAFYTNPPFGASNGGRSVEAFLRRGDEALAEDGIGCVVVADDPKQSWTRQVMQRTQGYLLGNGFMVTEVLPQFHRYHLDDDPDLTSCSLIAVRQGYKGVKTTSSPLSTEEIEDFYGDGASLDAKYIRDLRKGGSLPSQDHSIEPLS